MKILFLSDVYFPRVNGVSTSIATFRRELQALGHTVHLIAPDYFMPSEDESGITRVPSRHVPMDPEDRLMGYHWVVRKLECLRAKKYDIIHIQTPFVAHYLGVRLSRLLGIPCVESYHTFFEEYLFHYVPYMPKAAMRWLARRFSHRQCNQIDGMVVPSHQMLEVLRRYGVNTPAQVIPTGLEPRNFVPGDGVRFRSHLGIELERPTMLFVGRVAHEKNIGFLLQVLARVLREMPQALLIIAGEGPARESLRQQAQVMGILDSIRFIGYLDRHTELLDCYRAGDLFVFSSRTETQGLVLLEAMAQGVPVVSTAEMGTKDVLCDGMGVWVARENVEDFSGKAIVLLRDAEERRRLGAKGVDYAHQWSATTLAQRLVTFYDEVPDCIPSSQKQQEAVSAPISS